MVMVPVAPHSLRSRPLVTAPGEVITVELGADNGSRAASHFVDGSRLRIGEMANVVNISTGERPTTLLRYNYDGFYPYAARTFL
jgi:NAD+ kinase